MEDSRRSKDEHVGTCHCGAVRFEVDVDLGAGAGRCNCSLCTKLGLTGAIVRPEAFRLVAGEASLRAYRSGAKVSTRLFCGTCGVHCFARGHLAELGGDFVSFNVNCLEGIELAALKVRYWDGRNDAWSLGPRSSPWPTRATTAA